MVNSFFHLAAAPRDLGFERFDAGLELVDGKRVEVLAREQGHRIGVALGQGFVRLHDDNVDRSRARVNNGGLLRRTKRDMALIPEWMTAIDPAEKGGPEILIPVRRAVPAPGPAQVLVRVAAAGVNRPDVVQRKGGYPPPPGAPSIPGLEIAGEVVATGPGVMPEMLGQQVCALIPGGGYAEYAVADEGLCLPVPEALSLVEAAALPETLFTVWSNLFERAYVMEGEQVLVHGGTSGIGTMAIALCGLFGVRIIVTAGSDEKCRRALGLGATHAINYRTRDFVAEVRRITGGEGVNAVLDMVGGDYLPRNLDCLADDGRHVSIAALGGPKAELAIGRMMTRRLTLTGSTLRPRSVAFKTLIADEIARNVWPHVEAGELRPVIDSTFPLAEAADAHRRMEGSGHVGKIVLTMG
jgi:NADPH2:quinone reductase